MLNLTMKYTFYTFYLGGKMKMENNFWVKPEPIIITSGNPREPVMVFPCKGGAGSGPSSLLVWVCS